MSYQGSSLSNLYYSMMFVQQVVYNRNVVCSKQQLDINDTSDIQIFNNLVVLRVFTVMITKLFYAHIMTTTSEHGQYHGNCRYSLLTIIFTRPNHRLQCAQSTINFTSCASSVPF